MIAKILRIFRRDALVATRDSMLILIIAMPIALAVGILLFAPGITDSSVRIGLLKDDGAEHIAFMENYAQVELFGSVQELERRVNKRDEIAGMVFMDPGYEIIVQGDEDPGLLNYAKFLNSLFTLGITREDATAQMLSFEKTVPPLKTKLVNMLILMMIMLAGMIISLGIVEEKADNTINAINVTPVSQNGFIVGKSLLGVVSTLGSIVVSLLILGYRDIDWLMILLVGLTSMMLTFIVGFLQGLGSDDVIAAAAGVKMTMLPIAGSIAGYELLAERWQWTMYWSPFYWAYKANDLILSKRADWPTVLVCVGLVLGISMLIFIMAMPKIRKGLS
ncbi:MAG: ABC transporter permease [Spirochaetes bacterium]|nr:ABC transporter permease [Spirochaetota bacterium]MBU1080955.1 ABC transporter permease [Spirochaetota bacterium]